MTGLLTGIETGQGMISDQHLAYSIREREMVIITKGIVRGIEVVKGVEIGDIDPETDMVTGSAIAESVRDLHTAGMMIGMLRFHLLNLWEVHPGQISMNLRKESIILRRWTAISFQSTRHM
jgi:hypothetical protein